MKVRLLHLSLYRIPVQIKISEQVCRPLNNLLSYVLFVVASDWAEWGEWSECDPSSYDCKKFRFRHCINAPSPAVCNGHSTETAPCSELSNPGGLFKVESFLLRTSLVQLFLKILQSSNSILTRWVLSIQPTFSSLYEGLDHTSHIFSESL